MGVSFGRFYPDIEFESAMVEPEVRIHLSVKSAATDELLICEGVGIMTSEVDPEDIEVEVLGIQESQYSRLFPEHVAGD